MRVLIQEKPHTLLPEEQREAGYREYRRFGEQHAGNVPFYVYGEKLAVLIFEDGQEPHIVIITSAMVSKAYREQFEIMWDIAKPLEMSRTAAKKLLA